MAVGRVRGSILLRFAGLRACSLWGELIGDLSRRESLFRVAAFLVLLFALSAAAGSQDQRLSLLIREGQDALDARDFAHAAQVFEQAWHLAPESNQASRGLLLSYLEGGRLGEAEEIGQAAVARWPQDVELLHWLGLVYFKQHRNDLAVLQLQRAESLASSQYDVHFDLALVLLSDDHYSEAANELEKAVKIDPKAALAHVLLGRAYQNTNRSLQAVEQFQTALRLDPNLPLGHYHLAFAYASLGRNDEAIAEYERELQRSANNPSVLYQLGHCQVEAGEWKSAIAHLKKATEIDPQNSDASYDLGKALLLQGDAEGALPALRHAIELKPSNPSPHYQLARALDKLGSKEEAKRELETFSALKKAQPVTGGMAAGPVQ
jgi:tetratricopeptide (TPR) repeat protein